VPEGENKLAKTVLLVAAVAVPTSAVVFFHNHPVIAAIGGESLVFVTAFLAKVWDKLETQYVDRECTIGYTTCQHESKNEAMHEIYLSPSTFP
jgi:hypothetical protein